MPTHRAGAVAVVLGAVIGALAGSAVGFVAGGSLAMRGPGDDGRLQQNVRADAHRRTES